MLETYAVCDYCEDTKVPRDRVDVSIDYENVMENGQQFYNVRRWVVRAYPDPEDQIAVEVEYYCPDCASLDKIYDSGDRAGV